MWPRRCGNVEHCKPAKIWGEMQITDCQSMHTGISPKILAGVQYSTLKYLWGHTYFYSLVTRLRLRSRQAWCEILQICVFWHRRGGGREVSPPASVAAWDYIRWHTIVTYLTAKSISDWPCQAMYGRLYSLFQIYSFSCGQPATIISDSATNQYCT